MYIQYWNENDNIGVLLYFRKNFPKEKFQVKLDKIQSIDEEILDPRNYLLNIQKNFFTTLNKFFEYLWRHKCFILTKTLIVDCSIKIGKKLTFKNDLDFLYGGNKEVAFPAILFLLSSVPGSILIVTSNLENLIFFKFTILFFLAQCSAWEYIPSVSSNLDKLDLVLLFCFGLKPIFFFHLAQKTLLISKVTQKHSAHYFLQS